MELKSDFLLSPKEMRMKIYAHLPLPTLALLLAVSKQIQGEIQTHIQTLYPNTHQMVLDFFNSKDKSEADKTLYEDYKISEWLQNSLCFHQAIEENYLQFSKYFISLKERVDERPCMGQIYLVVQDNELVCSTLTYLHKNFRITLTANWFEDSPLTLDTVWNYKDIVIDKLGKLCVEHFLADFNYYLLKFFKDDRFVECYKKNKIDYKSLYFYLRFFKFTSNFENVVLSVVNDLAQNSLQLSDYVEFFSHDNVLQWLNKYPHELETLRKSANFNEKISLLKDKRFFALIGCGITINECFRFGEKLFRKEKLLYPDYTADLGRRVYYEFFCEGFGEHSRYSKGKAILELLSYVNTRENEDKESLPLLTMASNFFKSGFSIDYHSKVQAAKALVLVLFEKPNALLSKDEIYALTRDLGSEKEDRLTKIVRTMVLEPFQLGSLEELNPKPRLLHDGHRDQ